MGTEESTNSNDLIIQTVPLLPLRDVVVFPHTVIPLFIGRKSSVNAITHAMEADKNIFLVTQKDESIEDPSNDDLHRVGTLASILQLLKLPDGTIKVLVEGIKRANIDEFIDVGGYTEVVLSDCILTVEDDTEINAMMRLALENIEKYIKLSKKIPEEVFKVLKEITDIERFSDVIIANLNLKIGEKQSLLESHNAKDRLEKILTILESELDLLGAEQKIQSRVRKQMESNQRDYYLNEQMKSIQKELGTLDDENEIEELQQNINKANILCLVGPPGVGKTSLGESIARSVNRKYVRMALGGVRDEAEIRGHRRTYIGAMPGSIVQKMQKVKVKNPLFLLDEIDKMASDYRGDPSSAMLEVLDPEQNHTFNDHYLEVDYDLSQVMFVATANTLDLPQALSDRMEIIQISGYTEDEKLQIAKQHLIAKQMKNNGVKDSEIVFKDPAILDMIRYYTREAGVRNLDREIGSICRKVVKSVTLKKRKARAIINSKSLPKFLGMKRHRFGLAEEHNQIGEVTGLAWTSVGGDLLTIEATTYKGKGKLNYTGQLGDVMKESIQAAMSVTRARANELNIKEDFHEKLDIHIHVPDGATPKDGPSAGAAMCTALVSVLTGRKVKATVAMTGEITLRGEITPIGGLKEKLLAALRGGIKTVIIPEDNERELSEVPDKIKGKLEIIKVKWIDQVLDIALEK